MATHRIRRPVLERIAKNEAVFRATNREIERVEQEGGGAADGVLEVICECGIPAAPSSL